MTASQAVVVTGGAGFIGSAACRHLLESGSKVFCLDALTYAASKTTVDELGALPNFYFIHADIRDPACLTETFKTNEITAILNFAAESHVDRSISSPSEFLSTNVMGTFNLLQQARGYFDTLPAEQKEKFRFLHVSTDEVYGDLGANDPAFSEQTAYAPSSPYSASKAASDHLVSAWARTYNLPTLITNCSNNYGPYQFPEKLIPVVISKCLDGESIPIYGKGHQIRDWLYVGDHVDAIATVLKNAAPGGCYNIGTRNELTNIELVKTICKILDQLAPRDDGSAHSSAIKHVVDRPGHDQRYAVDPTKLEQDFKWHSKNPFAQALESTIQWYLKNEAWWRPLLAK